MLRVIRFEEPFSIHVRLEGPLTADYVHHAEHEWQEVRVGARGRKLLFDVSAVTAADASGRAFLQRLYGAGVRLDDGGHHLLPEGAVPGVLARMRHRFCAAWCSLLPTLHLCPCAAFGQKR